jgi:uncharacterized protein YhaN
LFYFDPIWIYSGLIGSQIQIMPTEEWFKDNPKVSAYISSELSQRLEEWMKKQGIKKISQGLTRILEEYLGVVQVEPIQPTVDGDRLGDLEAKLAELTQRFEAMEGAIEALLPPVESSLPVNQSSNSQLSILEESQETEVDQTELNESELWTTKQLEEVGIIRSTVQGWRSSNKLPKNSKGYTVVRWAGKQSHKPFGDLWEVNKLPLAPEN